MSNDEIERHRQNWKIYSARSYREIGFKLFAHIDELQAENEQLRHRLAAALDVEAAIIQEATDAHQITAREILAEFERRVGTARSMMSRMFVKWVKATYLDLPKPTSAEESCPSE